VRVTWLIDPEVAKEIFTDNISYYKCDVSDWEQVKNVAEVVMEEVILVPRLLTLSNV
jgi:NAD(P)-dependent dehydrogenase (short-subunit alcohol dehydrogenase family)